MNEHGFIQAVHRRLPKWVKVWKIKDDFQSGVPDAVYFGYEGRCLWVEYKYIKELPKRCKTIVKSKPEYKSTQKVWFRELNERKQKAVAIYGSELNGVLGGVWIDREEDIDSLKRSEFAARFQAIGELGGRLTNHLS